MEKNLNVMVSDFGLRRKGIDVMTVIFDVKIKDGVLAIKNLEANAKNQRGMTKV